jgi:hypothetical protein
MFDYLQQFNNLSKDLRDQVSSPSAMAMIVYLEGKYRVDLATTVMKVMVKTLPIKNLPAYFVSELALSPETAESLAREMKEKVFASVADYLGLSSEMRALDLDKDIDILIKEAGLALPSAVLIGRFKNIVSTYLRGVRNKIDTKNSLAKDVKIGGLNLSPAEIDRVLKVCETQKFNSLKINTDLPTQPAAVPANRLDKIIAGSDGVLLSPVGKTEEYDLKKALADGKVKMPAASPETIRKTPASSVQKPVLDTKHEIAAPHTQLDFPKQSADITVSSPVPAKPIVEPIRPPKIVPTAVAPAAAPVSRLAPLRPTVAQSSIQSAGSFVKPPIAPSAAPAPAAPAAIKTASQSPAVKIPVAPSLANRPAPAPSSPRPQMHDIKPVPKVMGPIEELQFLDLVNFRRLGKTPGESTTKVFMKIKLLEKDGYDKMISGIQAWRQSPVNRLYLRLGQEAVARGVPFKEAITIRQKSNQEYLSMEEVEAIVALNSRLVF